MIAVFAGQAAVFFHPFDAVGIEHFAPKIRVITGRVAAGEGVREIKAAITRRHRRKIDPGFLQRLLSKRDCVLRNLGRFQLMPCLIEQRRGEVLGCFVSLIEFVGRLHFIEQRLRNRFAGLIMFRVIFQDFRPVHPHLVDLRRILDEIARHARSAEARILHVRKHSVERMTEFMKGRAHLVKRQQRRLAIRGFGNVEMIRDDRFRAEERVLSDILIHPGAATF